MNDLSRSSFFDLSIYLVGPELTDPIEEGIAFWNEKKTGKYEKMIADHGSPSWKLKCIVAEAFSFTN